MHGFRKGWARAIQSQYKRKRGNISGRQATAKARTKAKYGDSSLRSE
jgi:hypothetical protein